MDIFIILVTIFGFFSITILLMWFIILREKKHEIEIGKEEVYKEVIGLRIRNFSITSPFVKLRMYDDFFVISFIERVALRYEEIENYKRKKFLFKRIIIYLKEELRLKSFPLGDLVEPSRQITLYAKNANKVCEMLKAHGVKEINN